MLKFPFAHQTQTVRKAWLFRVKVVKSISLFFLYPLGMFLLGGFSFFMMETYFYPGKQPEVIEEAAAEENQVLTSDTQYVIIEADLLDGSSAETTWNIPEQYIGMDREKFLEAMEIYEKNPPLTELNKGLVGVEVKSFSAQKVVIRKNYFFSGEQHFYLTVRDNLIVVMCEDLKTVYMNTTILLSSLPERIQAEIMLNKYMESEKELYDFLETYSS